MRPNDTTVPRVCEECAQPFQERPCIIARGGGRFCSRACSGASRRRTRVTVNCAQCGKAFWVHRHRAADPTRGLFCSRSCGASHSGTKPIADRIRANVDTSQACWRWQAAVNNKGYGRINGSDGNELATHAAWRIAGGSLITKGYQINHTCDEPSCCRADDVGTYEVAGVLYERRGHLWLGTHDANMADMAAKGRSGQLGERSSNAKLTAATVLESRRRHAVDGATDTELAREHGVAPRTMRDVLNRKTWCHLP